MSNRGADIMSVFILLTFVSGFMGGVGAFGLIYDYNPPDYWDGYFDHMNNLEYDPGYSEVEKYDKGWSDATDEIIHRMTRDMIEEELNEPETPVTPSVPDVCPTSKTIKVSESQFEKLEVGERFHI